MHQLTLFNALESVLSFGVNIDEHLTCNLQAPEITYEHMITAKQLGFSDKQIAKCIHR